jgi:hypothetical protein
VTKTYDLADPEDFIALEPSSRPNFWEVTVYDAEGEPTVVHSGRRDEGEQMVQAIRTALGTWPGFTTYPSDPSDPA